MEKHVEIKGKCFHCSIECALAHARQETALALEICQDISAGGEVKAMISRAHPERLINMLTTSGVVPGKKAVAKRTVEFIREVMDMHQPKQHGREARI